MIGRALTAAFQGLSRPGPLVGIALAAAVTGALTALLSTTPSLPVHLLRFGLSLLGWYLYLGLQAVALALVRGERDARSQWALTARKFLQFFLVGMGGAVMLFLAFVLSAAVLAVNRAGGTVFMVGLGILALYLAVVFSQYSLLIIDRDLDALDAIALSADLTKEHRLELLGLFAATIVVILLFAFGVNHAEQAAGFLGPATVAGRAITAALQAAAAACFACVNAAVYLELDRDLQKRLGDVEPDLTGSRSSSLSISR
ncbi:MAG TPA: hypothetical protein VGL62_12810, partial [Vicinamibacterales bacterium]|jgi:hypothetical protein